MAELWTAKQLCSVSQFIPDISSIVYTYGRETDYERIVRISQYYRSIDLAVGKLYTMIDGSNRLNFEIIGGTVNEICIINTIVIDFDVAYLIYIDADDGLVRFRTNGDKILLTYNDAFVETVKNKFPGDKYVTAAILLTVGNHVYKNLLLKNNKFSSLSTYEFLE